MSTTAPQRPLSRRIQARAMSFANGPMRFVLGLPFSTPLGGRLMLAHLTGRKTGRHYKQPLSYVRDGETLLTPAGGNWKRNLHGTDPVRLRIAGKDVRATAEIVRDPDEVIRLLKVLTSANPAANSFIGLPKDSGGNYDRTKLELALHYGFGVVRWHLMPEEAQ